MIKFHNPYKPYTGKKKAKVIDPNYPKFYNKVFPIEATRKYKDSVGKTKIFYQLRVYEDSILCHYFGKSQVELIDK